jgi:pentatricopeptide repeat protein
MRAAFSVILLLFFASNPTLSYVHHWALNQRNLFGISAYQDKAPLPPRIRNDVNDFNFESCLSKCRYQKNFDPAVEMAEKALLLRPMHPSLLTSVIKVFGEAGQLGRAVSLLKAMEEDMNVVPNEFHLGALIVACRRCGQVRVRGRVRVRVRVRSGLEVGLELE